MMRLFPNEIPCLMPGVKPVHMLTPCETEIVNEDRSTPESTSYVLSVDKTFETGKTYYTLQSGTVATYVEATVTAGNDIPQPNKTYFEKIVVPAVSASTQTVYDRYTDGMWNDIVKTSTGGEQAIYREHAVEIFRTVTFKQGTEPSVTQHVVREHALGLWANRHKLKYVSISHRIDETSGESARIFT